MPLRVLATILGLAGVLLVADGILTVVWQEPISALYQRIAQHRLARDLRALERAQLSAHDRQALGGLGAKNQRMTYLARSLESRATTGSAVGRVKIPRIGLNAVVVAGTSVPALKKGPGIYTDTAFPGARGAVGIAGHRTTYAAPFRRVNELAQGNTITVRMPYGRFVYTVDTKKTVSPSDVGVLRQGNGKLVLTTCTPLFSAAKRLVIIAHLSSAQPLGATTARISRPAVQPVSKPAAASHWWVDAHGSQPLAAPQPPGPIVLG